MKHFIFVILVGILSLNCTGIENNKVTHVDKPLPHDTTKVTNINVEHLNKKLKGGVLENKGQLIVDKAKENGVSPYFLASIIILESNAGKSKLAKRNYNFGGIKVSRLKYRKFASIEDSISYMARLIKNNYHANNLRSVKSINKKYAADTNWHKKVSAIMISLYVIDDV